MNLMQYIKQGGFLLCVGLSLCLVSWSFAQTKSSYEDRLSQIASREADRSLGTISGQNKDEMRKKELFDAYTYQGSGETMKEITTEVQAVAQAPKSETLESEYVDFRREHKIPDYIGDDVAKQALMKTKNVDMKVEVIKIVEAEKLLQDTFQAYHGEKEKSERESIFLKAAGAKKDFGIGAHQKEMNDRIDVIAEKTATILNTSRQKLASSKLIDETGANREVYMSSGGRAFPKLGLEEDKDLLNIRSQVMDRVQRELMSSLASAINTFYLAEQKETTQVAIQKKEQILAFVRAEPTTISQHDALQVQEIKGFVRQWANKVNDGKDGSVALNDAQVDYLVEQILRLQNESNGVKFDASKLQQFFENNAAQTAAWTKLGTDPAHFSPDETKALNQQFIQTEKSGSSPIADMFRPGVDPHRLSPAEREEFNSAMKAWSQDRSANGFSSQSGSPNTGSDSTDCRGGACNSSSPPCTYQCDAPPR